MPDLWRAVVRRAGLGSHDALLSDLTHIHISELHSTVRTKEDVCTFDVSVDDILGMESHQAFHHLPEDVPDLVLFDEGLELLGLRDFGIKITAVGHLHDNAQNFGALVEEGLFVTNHVLVVYRG